MMDLYQYFVVQGPIEQYYIQKTPKHQDFNVAEIITLGLFAMLKCNWNAVSGLRPLMKMSFYWKLGTVWVLHEKNNEIMEVCREISDEVILAEDLRKKGGVSFGEEEE